MAQVSPEQLARLWDEHAAALVLFARGACAWPEDVVQEAFIKLAAQSPPPERPVPWLFVAVRRLAATARRADARRRTHQSAAATTAWFEESPATRLDAQAAAEALAELSPGQRDAVVAHVWGGLTFDDIAELLGVSRSAAYREYLAALAALRERLGATCPSKPVTGN